MWSQKRAPESCNRIVVSTSRCGRDNPGSNPGYSNIFSFLELPKNCEAKANRSHIQFRAKCEKV